jgi:hypothetical protein
MAPKNVQILILRICEYAVIQQRDIKVEQN